MGTKLHSPENGWSMGYQLRRAKYECRPPPAAHRSLLYVQVRYLNNGLLSRLSPLPRHHGIVCRHARHETVLAVPQLVMQMVVVVVVGMVMRCRGGEATTDRKKTDRCKRRMKMQLAEFDRHFIIMHST